MRLQVAHLQPLVHEVVREARGAPAGQHAADLLFERVRIRQRPAGRGFEQRVVRDAAPQEERQPGGQLQVAHAVCGRRRRAGRLLLDADQEVRRRQDRLQRQPDARLEIALAAAQPVDLQQRPNILLGHRTPIGPPRQRGDDLPRARLVVATTGIAGQDPLAAGRRVWHRAVERAGDLDLVDADPRTGRDGRRGRVGERGGYGARARLDRQADLHVVVRVHAVAVNLLAADVVLVDCDHRAGIQALDPAANRKPLHQRVVHAQLDLILVLLDAQDRTAAAAPLQQQLEDVLAVEREGMPDGQSAVRREGQRLAHPGVLPRPCRHGVDVPGRAVVGAGERRAADLHRRGHVAGHQHRRDGERIRVVVETEAGHVAGQQRVAVDFEGQQVADGVDVLGAVQAVGRNPAGIGLGAGVDRGLQARDEGVDRRRIGTRPALGRHQPVAQLADHLLEHRRIGARVADVHVLQRQPAGHEPVAVAGDAVAVQERPTVSRRLRGGRPRSHSGQQDGSRAGQGRQPGGITWA